MTKQRPDHAAVAAGLRELADWYEQHPEVPVPIYPTFTHVLESFSDKGIDNPETVELIAAALDAEVDYDNHVGTGRMFGVVSYQVTHISDEAMRDHEARRSYANNIVTAGGAA